MDAKNSKNPKSSDNKKSKNSDSEKVESTTEVHQEKIDVTKGDWRDSNGPIKFSPSLKKWYCTICEIELPTAINSGIHVRDIHGIKLVSKKDDEKDKKESSTEEKTETQNDDVPEGDNGEGENGKVDRSSSQRMRKEIFGDSIKYDRGIRDTGDLALQINIEEESKLVSQLIKNPYVTFLFAKLKDERKIYPDWTLADFLREGALYLCKKLGCEITFEFNIELLKKDKQFSEIAIKINEAWEEYDAETKLEKAASPIKT